MLFASKTELAVFCLLASLSANGFMQMLVSVWVVVSRVNCAEDKDKLWSMMEDVSMMEDLSMMEDVDCRIWWPRGIGR